MKLKNGIEIPKIGFGTFFGNLIDTNKVKGYIECAIENGYRLFDTAYNYGTEDCIGEAVEGAIEQKAVTREELFIQTKFHGIVEERAWERVEKQAYLSSRGGYYEVLRQFEESINKLRTEYIDPELFISNPKLKYVTILTYLSIGDSKNNSMYCTKEREFYLQTGRLSPRIFLLVLRLSMSTFSLNSQRG